MIDAMKILVDKVPWLVTAAFFLFAIVILLAVVAIAYALKTGRPIKLWNMEIGPRRDHSEAYPGLDLNKQRGSLSPDLRELLSFVEDQTTLRQSVPQTDFDPPKFPHYAYWMLEVLIAHGFIEKESIGQRADAPIYSYKLSPVYKRLLGRV